MSEAAVSRILVVGGGLAAARSCEQLSRQGHQGPITLISSDTHLPYDLPPLTKEVMLGKKDVTTLNIDWEKLGVTVHLGVTATGLDLTQQFVRTSDDGGSVDEFPFDALIIATGATPITLPEPDPLRQRVVRTIDDALSLRERLAPGGRVTIIGASWIGAEVATAALAAGATVTCVEAGPAPLAGALGTEVGTRFLSWWDGIDLRLNSSVVAITDRGIRLDNGDFIASDVIVTGVGVRANTGWLESSGIDLDRGVAVDSRLRARRQGVPIAHVVAVGDVAAWHSEKLNLTMRLGHWDDAATGPTVAAATLLHPDEDDLPTHDPVPYFWSDQFGHKLQYVGHHDERSTLHLRVPVEGRGWTACWVDTDDTLQAVLAVDRPKDMVMGRRAIANQIRINPAILVDTAVPLG